MQGWKKTLSVREFGSKNLRYKKSWVHEIMFKKFTRLNIKLAKLKLGVKKLRNPRSLFKKVHSGLVIKMEVVVDGWRVEDWGLKVEDQGFRIEDRGLKIKDWGSRIQDQASGIEDPGTS